MNTIIEKIRAEIERRMKELDEQIVDIYDSKAVLRKDELQRLLPFLSTLEPEKPMNQDGLEKEYKDYVENDPVYGKLVNRNAGLGIARHFAQWGAEWQAKQDQETIELAEDHAYLAGAVNEREKMMKEAVEYEVGMHGEPIKITFDKYIQRARGIFPGDKVRIIIVKED